MPHSIGKTIADLRTAHGWTQSELAQKLNVSDKAVSKWEKDNGMPSIEFLPLLAELFDTSVDYLLTGKQLPNEVVFITKEEYCAQKDDLKFFSEDLDYAKLSQYAVQYKSKKVLAALVDTGKGYYFDKACYKYDFIKLERLYSQGNAYEYRPAKNDFLRNGMQAIVTDTFYEIVLLLMEIDKERLAYGETEFFHISTELRDMGANQKIVNYLVDNYEHLPKGQKEYYFGTPEGIKANENGWIIAFPHLLHRAYTTGKLKLVELLLGNMETANSYAKEKRQQWFDRFRYEHPNRHGGTYELSVSKLCFNLRYPEARPLRETVEAAYAQHDKKWGDRFNVLLEHGALSEYEIKSIWVDHDKSKSEQEKLIEKAIHRDLLFVDDALQIDDFEIIKKLINENPIHRVEIAYDFLQHKKWNKLLENVETYDLNFENAIEIKTAIAQEDCNAAEKWILKYYWNDESRIRSNVNLYVQYKNLYKKLYDPLPQEGRENFMPNGQYLFPVSGELGSRRPQFQTLSECIDYIKQCKQKILIDYQQKIAREKAQAQLQSEKEKTDYLTKEYFESELAKGNIDLVIVKLCVRLEAVLRCDYHLDGDFSEILTEFCGNGGETADVLHKLRKNRNNIVHSASDATVLTADEIHACIDYICGLTK